MRSSSAPTASGPAILKLSSSTPLPQRLPISPREGSRSSRRTAAPRDDSLRARRSHARAGSPTERPAAGSRLEEPSDALAREVEEGLEAPATYFTGLWEDAGADVVERFEQLEGPEWNVLDEHVASEVMSQTVFSVGPETDVREAARRMLDADVHRALVVEDGRLVGVVTSLDILRAVAEHGLGA